MKPYVYIGHPIEKETEAYIAKHCHYKIWNEENEKVPEVVLKQELKHADGAMLTATKVTDEIVRDANQLKVISTVSVGYDQFDVDVLSKHGIYGTHTPYVLDDTVADLIFGILLSASRRIGELHHYVKKGKWTIEPDSAFYGQDVHHKTLGIVGMGRIGEKIVRRAKLGFEMDIVYHNRSRKPEIEEQYDVSYVELEELLKTADFVLLMVPLTDETVKLIGANELSLMKSTAVLINGARGPVIDEGALVQALKNKDIFSAALDVFETEPLPSDHPFLQLDNVTLTPHIGSATLATTRAMEMRAAENVVQGALGNVPRDVIPELKSRNRV
ncbi:2-hydroxyacid dehydrogenase [Geomicrobium sediminis]|uniref:Gluconate 2-dehydrogenase n=1 Tax=Geomicrobium sediminis TaxID=1347788 RepID=A0ABS2P7H0_9BACL|nr:D-glycerate dehydrogenase [Geomicrobium sediminis]MBM7631232.1 gluconate 2-dehydrogenase [Geomicrobium sediminis]